MKRFLFASIFSLAGGLATGLLWVAVIVFPFLLAYLFLVTPIFRSKSFGTMAKGFVMAIVIFCIVVLLRVFVFEIYKVAGESMEDTLMEGDRILVSKLHYGPLLPYKLFGSDGRLKGMRDIKVNDIVLFSLRTENRPVIKRIVGVPGDTIQIADAHLYVDHRMYVDPLLSKRMYQLWPNNIDSLYKRLIAEKLESYFDNRQKSWFAFLTVEQCSNFLNSSLTDSVHVTSRFLTRSAKKIFHDEGELQWNVNNMGPIVIPKTGMTIPLNEQHYLLYHKTILLDEGHDLQFNEGKFTVDGEPAKAYTFKYNYYYTVGDNFDRSLDSRHHGFIKEPYIIGKATMLVSRSTTKENAFFNTLE